MTSWRYIAQRALTGEILDLDVPLNVSTLSWALSAAGSLQGTVTPDTGRLRAGDDRLLLEEWGTYLYAEADGIIRWGGIVVSSRFDGAAWSVEAAGFASYPHGLPYLGNFERIGVDPADAVRELWSHLQAHPDGDLGVQVVGSTPVRVGTAASGTEGADDYVEADPYHLAWWEAPDCGSEIDSLAREAPFDFVEEHAWSGDSITHTIRVAHPRIGRRRDDLVFVQGDNVTSVVTYQREGDDYANEVVGLGAGEGEASLRRSTAVRDGRLRRAAVYTAKDVTSSDRLDALIADELERARLTLSVDRVDVVDHPNAPIGSWSLGDDVLVQADVPWLGPVDVWCRVVGWTLTGESTASLTLARSDSFRYGG